MNGISTLSKHWLLLMAGVVCAILLGPMIMALSIAFPAVFKDWMMIPVFAAAAGLGFASFLVKCPHCGDILGASRMFGAAADRPGCCVECGQCLVTPGDKSNVR